MEVAVKRFIKYKAKPPCRLGIISFGVSANILVNLTEVNHRTRDGLLAKIPSNFSKGNAIDEGLLTAVEVE